MAIPFFRFTHPRLPDNVTPLTGYPDFTPGAVAHFDRFAQCLPFESMSDEGLVLTRGLTPEHPEGIGFVLELTPQTGADEALQNDLIGLTALLPVGSVVSISTYASPNVTERVNWLTPSENDIKSLVRTEPIAPVSQQTAQLLFGMNAGLKAHLERLAHPRANGEGLMPTSLRVRHYRSWLVCIVPFDSLTNLARLASLKSAHALSALRGTAGDGGTLASDTAQSAVAEAQASVAALGTLTRESVSRLWSACRARFQKGSVRVPTTEPTFERSPRASPNDTTAENPYPHPVANAAPTRAATSPQSERVMNDTDATDAGDTDEPMKGLTDGLTAAVTAESTQEVTQAQSEGNPDQHDGTVEGGDATLDTTPEVALDVALDDALTQLCAKVRSLREAMVTTLTNNALFSHVWDAQTLVATLSELLTLPDVTAGDWVPPVVNPYAPLNVQVMSPETDLVVEKTGIRFRRVAVVHGDTATDPRTEATSEERGSGDAAARSNAASAESSVIATSLVLKNYPAPWHLWSASLLMGSPERGGTQIPSPFVMTSIMRVLDEADERMKASSHHVRALQMQRSQLSLFTNHYLSKAREWQHAVNSFKGEGGIEAVSHIVTVFAHPSQHDRAVQAVKSLARQLGGEWREMTGLHTLGLMATLPLCCGPLLADDLKTVGLLPRRTGATALAGAPVVLEWQGSERRVDETRPTPLVTLVGRRGELMPLDPFANRNGGYSMAIVGMPGSGKSLLMNALASATLLRGGIVWVIDIGRSYEKIADLFSGDFLEFSERDVWNLNPLQLLANGSTERLDDVVAIMAELLSPHEALGQLERSTLTNLIADIVRHANREGRVANFTDLAYALDAVIAQTGDQRIRDLRTELGPYLGPYAQWFDGTGRPLTFQNRFSVLELEGLKGHAALRQAVLMTLMLIIEDTMSKDRETIKMVFIDEAWDLMKVGHSAQFIESGFRRARKHRGSFVVATQGLKDFFSSPTAEAAWSCAETKCFLRQNSDQVASLIATNRFSADPGFLAQLKSLTTVAGEFSEMIVKSGDNPMAIGRFTIDRRSQLLFSSNPAEVAQIRRWQRAGATLLEAVTEVALGHVAPEGTDEAPRATGTDTLSAPQNPAMNGATHPSTPSPTTLTGGHYVG